MTALAAENPDDQWLPDHCPDWCAGAHATALAEIGDWGSAQHLRGGGGECLPELNYAGRPCREFGAGWDLTATQRPLGPNGGLWGPALIEFSAHEADIKKRVNLRLTSGEARVLARQLVAMADLLDL